MADTGNHLVERIHASGYEACMVVSGGGIGAVHALLTRAGASRFVLDIRIPYSRAAMHDFLGTTPKSYCSEATARVMARTACNHAAQYTHHALGIACAAALRTTHEREDADRAFLCICSGEREVGLELKLSAGSREDQDVFVSNELLSLIARFVAE